MKHLLLNIKWAYQRAIIGYDDRIYWSFEDYFGDFIPTIKKFCEEQLEKKDFIELNPDRSKVFITTLALTDSSEFWEYFGKNMGYFWD